jgi:uncharacterized membrane protein (UPF0127 family)
MSHYALLIAQFRRRTAILILSLATVLASIGCRQATAHDIRLGGESYRVELATTPETRSRGLMYRRQLDPRGGMLLVYKDDGNHRIWMKNVPIALRVFWIDRNYRVVDARRLPPCKADPCPVYAADRDSRYVLELADRDHPLRPGDRVDGLEGL